MLFLPNRGNEKLIKTRRLRTAETISPIGRNDKGSRRPFVPLQLQSARHPDTASYHRNGPTVIKKPPIHVLHLNCAMILKDVAALRMQGHNEKLGTCYFEITQ